MEFDPERVEIIRLIFDLALAGHGARSIVLELDRLGAQTNPWKSMHHPRNFDGNHVSQTLDMAVYAALTVYHAGRADEETFDGKWPALISPEDFFRLREERRTCKKKPQRGRSTQTFVLARVATCGLCGAPMHSTTGGPRADGSRLRRYVCRTHAERPQDCSAPPVDAEVVDRAFVANLTAFLGDVNSWRGQLVTDHEAEVTSMSAEVSRAQVGLDKAESTVRASRRRWEHALAASDGDRTEAIEEAMVETRAERERARRRLEAALAARESIEQVPGAIPFSTSTTASLRSCAGAWRRQMARSRD